MTQLPGVANLDNLNQVSFNLLFIFVTQFDLKDTLAWLDNFKIEHPKYHIQSILIFIYYKAWFFDQA